MSEHPAVENLRTCQRQLDADGVEVGVSRQAVDETLAELARTERERDAAMSNFRDAWQALLRLREEVESRSGGMVAPEHTGPEFAHEAEQIARGVIIIYDRALAAERERDEARREIERLRGEIAVAKQGWDRALESVAVGLDNASLHITAASVRNFIGRWPGAAQEGGNG
jgi:hypothetical protein